MIPFEKKTYDVLKWIAQIFLPALGTLYFALASLWGFPYGQEVVGVLVSLNAFLGLLLGYSTTQFLKANPNLAESSGIVLTGLFIFNDKTYDVLKWIAQIFLPALGTLYFSLSSVLLLPYPEEVVGTITAIDVFLGVLLGISSMQYNKLIK